MAREPELSIKVKVDPQIKPTELKTSIERKVKQSGEKPQIDIDPNVDGIKKKVEDKLKNIKATASITPVVDTEKLKTDIQQQINGIGDIPKVTVGVNVDDFSDELSKRLKEELKSVNDKLSYYLKNLTTNTAGLNSVVEGLFPSRGISNAVQSELKSVQAELTAGLKGVKSKVKPFKETDLFQIGDTESTTTIRRVEKLVKNVRDQFASLDNFYDADEEKFLDGFNSEFEKFQSNASETVEKLSALKKNLSKDKFSDLLDNEDFDAESTTKALTPLISFLKKLSTTSIKTGEDYDNLYALFNNKNTNKLFDESNDHLTRMKTRVGDITAETKTAIEVTGELAKTLNKAIKDDNSGYLSDAEIKTYGAAFDEVLSNIATKQEEINTKKQRTVKLENDLLTKTRSNREALKQELEEYKNLLKSFGVKGDEDEANPKGKPKPKSKKPDKTPSQKPAEEPKAENQDALNNGIAKIQAIVFDINQDELQKSIDTIFAKVSAPIGFKPANGAIANIKQQLQEAFSDIEINTTNVNLQNSKTENTSPKYHILNKDELHKLDMELRMGSSLTFTDYKQGIDRFIRADFGKKSGFPELEPHEISIELAKELGNAMKSYDNGSRNNSVIDIIKKYGAKTDNDGNIIDFEEFVKDASYKFFGPKNRNKITSQNAARLQEMLQSQDKEIQAYASFIEKLNSKLVESKQFGPRAYFDDSDSQFYYSLSPDEQNAFSNFQTKSYLDKFERNLHANLVEPVDISGSSGYYFNDINTMVAEIYNLAQQRLIQSVGDLSGQTEAVKDQTSIPGKVTITDADVIVDVKNPVAIPGTVTVDPTSVQLGNSDALQKNANALSSVKQSLNKISTSAEDYGTKIAAIGPSVQYVAQEVDNLSKSLENQITDLDLIAKKTDAYGTTANSVTLNTKDVAVAGDPVNVPVKATLEKTAITVPKEAIDIKVSGVLAPEAVKQAEAAAPQKPTEVPGHVTLSADDVAAPTAPVNIPGKVTLKVEDVTPPKGSVKIPGKVELKVSDITPPKTAVELEGKVSNVTVDDSAKGKKKNAKDDIKKPDVIDLKGKVELKDEDIKRPNPLNLNGAVKIKTADVKIDDVEISKKEFDIKGNLILKNAEIDNAAKEAISEAAKVKKKNKPAKRENTKAANLNSVGNAISQNRATMKDVQKNYGTDYSFYSKQQEKDSKLKDLLDIVNKSSDTVSAAKEWAKNNLDISPDNINSVKDAINQLNIAYREATQEAKDFNKEASRERSINKASMEVANLKATIHDYIAEHKKLEGTDVGRSLYELLEALNQSDAPEKIGELKKKYAELRVESKKLGLESKNLLDVFEKLFGQHLSTMITMAALHKMQDALRIVYQNVVEIDTAVTELRKVSDYTGKSLEEYMGRAAEQAQKLGVSISDYIGSTADWKRLGYSDEDAENMATYSTLLKNVGDGIDDVNTSSSYLISTLQGFGLLAKDAENVVDQIDKVANTQPITAQAIGEILTRSAASMKAANNDLAETISLGTAAYAVIQNAETVGTTLKSVSMYLRAAKSELEDAGESADGCANSVSELRSELKSLTGVDIMIDNKNFKSTYQILKELSQVWDKLSDVTQANVTEMIGGKRNANAISAILNNFDVAESAMESAANSAGTAWEENSVWMDSIQGRLAQLDASFQVLSQDILSSGLVKTGVSFLTSIVKLLDKIINLTGALPAGLGIAAFATQLGKPKMTGFMIVPSNTPGGDTEQVLRRYFIISLRSMREYLVKPTNMVA